MSEGKLKSGSVPESPKCSRLEITVSWTTLLRLFLACELAYLAIRLWPLAELLFLALLISIGFRPLIQWAKSVAGQVGGRAHRGRAAAGIHCVVCRHPGAHDRQRGCRVRQGAAHLKGPDLKPIAMLRTPPGLRKPTRQFIRFLESRSFWQDRSRVRISARIHAAVRTGDPDVRHSSSQLVVVL